MSMDPDDLLRHINGDKPGVTYKALVQPQIVPAGYRFMQVPSNEGGHVATILELHTPTGVHVTFWPDESGLAFAGEFLKVARATAAGLILPPHKANPGLQQ